MDEAKISIRCPGCEEFIGFPGTEAGTIQECPECRGWVDVPELTRSPKLNDPYNDENARLLTEAARQSEENARLIEMSGKAQEETRRQLDQSARYQDQAQETFERFALLVSRWEKLTERFENVLKRLEPNDR